MKTFDEKGLTLIELIIVIALMAVIAAAGSALLSGSIQAHQQGSTKSALYREGMLLMERMVGRIQVSTYLLIPNGHNATRDILALSGFVNEDGDAYFDDPLFPRIDEDPGSDMTADSASGIQGVDDDGDAAIDDGGTGDDDEDGLNDEDKLDGVDNDGDGLIDEDFTKDADNNAKPGKAGIDDDGDGEVDEGNAKDDDEDGTFEEDPLNALIYQLDSGTGIFTESSPSEETTLQLSDHVTTFQVTLGATGCLRIILSLTGDEGDRVTFSEYVYPRNVLQKTGKRVR